MHSLHRYSTSATCFLTVNKTSSRWLSFNFCTKVSTSFISNEAFLLVPICNVTIYHRMNKWEIRLLRYIYRNKMYSSWGLDRYYVCGISNLWSSKLVKGSFNYTARNFESSTFFQFFIKQWGRCIVGTLLYNLWESVIPFKYNIAVEHTFNSSSISAITILSHLVSCVHMHIIATRKAFTVISPCGCFYSNPQ